MNVLDIARRVAVGIMGPDGGFITGSTSAWMAA
jgi:hypothetical protein